ncbi:ATP-binding cassette domain-containing protein [Streptomyces sp. NPDC005393]|uniref:ATP-binding cassette domain-containing protein n=1 Tax=Streptomyces sp. NPDC005393 TaxID=3157041 RepID=UPI0033B9C45E
MEEAPGSALLRLTDVSRAYGDRQVLRSATLDIAPGECVALMGDNGSGKSTLLRLASGRERPTSGEVLFDDEPIDEDAPVTRERVATVMDPARATPT